MRKVLSFGVKVATAGLISTFAAAIFCANVPTAFAVSFSGGLLLAIVFGVFNN